MSFKVLDHTFALKHYDQRLCMYNPYRRSFGIMTHDKNNNNKMKQFDLF